MTKIGITGAKGLLGSLLKKKLKKKKINYSIFSGDIKIKKEINHWIETNSKIEYIFHFAAISSPLIVKKNKKKAFKVNVLGTKNLVQVLKKKKKKIWFFFPSSSHVYDYSKKKITENHLLKPSSAYGKTKLSAEKIIMKNKSKNLSFFIGRIFSMYHQKQKKPFLYPSIKQKIRLNRKRKIYIKNGLSVRDFLNAQDVVEIIFKIFKKKLTGVYNIGSGHGISVKSFIEKQFNLKNIVTLNKNINTLVSNNNKLMKKLNE